MTRMRPAAKIMALIRKRSGQTTNGCKIWLGPTTGGYGTISFRGKPIRIHRFVYLHLVGPIPENLFVCHTCDTPRCWEPTHLFVGTNQDNTADKVRKNRQVFGEQKRLAKLTIEKVKYIRESGLSQHELARQLRVSVSTVHKVMMGQTWKEPTRTGPINDCIFTTKSH